MLATEPFNVYETSSIVTVDLATNDVIVPSVNTLLFSAYIM